jgi:hypothetical protein
LTHWNKNSSIFFFFPRHFSVSFFQAVFPPIFQLVFLPFFQYGIEKKVNPDEEEEDEDEEGFGSSASKKEEEDPVMRKLELCCDPRAVSPELVEKEKSESREYIERE